MNPLQLILIILIFLISAGTGLFVVSAHKSEKKKRLQNVIQGHGETTKEKKNGEKDEQNKRREEIAKKLKESKKEEDLADKKKKKTTISMMIEQAGLSFSIKQYWLLSIGTGILLALLAKLTGQSNFVIVMGLMIGFFGLPRFILKKKAAGRQKKFLEEFPDALEATVRLLKAGMPVSEAILMISREFTGPVGEEMSRIYDKQKIGVPLHEAALEATRRIPLPEMQMFATGLAIQAQTGASLSEVLINLSNVIRARFRLKRKVRALSSEAIASAGIIGALPNLVALGMYFANRDYIMILFETPIGKILLACAIIWMCIGIFVMRVMINFKV